MTELDAPQPPGKVEATAAAIAGPAFAGSCLFLRDATLLPAPVLDAAAAVLVAVGLAPLAHRRLDAAAATMVRAAGLAGAALLLSRALVPPFDRAMLPVAAWMLGAGLLQAATRMRRPLLPTGAGLALLAGGWAGALLAAPSFPEPGRLRVALLVAGPAALAGLALRAGLLRGRWRALAPMPVGILLVVALGTAYASYRPLVADRLANLPLYEWTLGVGVASLLLTRLRRQAREHEAPEAWSGAARRHAQDVAPAYDARMGPVAAVLQRYLDTGDGFEEYRAALLRAAPLAPPAYGRAVQALRATQGRPRSRAARDARLAAHRDVLAALQNRTEVSHGIPTPRVRENP